MRRAAWLLLILLSWPPGAHAQAAEAAVPVGFTVVHDFDTRAVSEVNCTRGPCPDGEPGCGSDHISIDPDGVGFTFDESETGTGCAQALAGLPVPAGAQTLTVTFWADRTITQRTDVTGQDTPIDAVQELLLYIKGPNADPAKIPVFDAALPSQEGRLHTGTFGLDGLSGQHATVAVAWLFSDEGPLGSQTIPLPDGNVAFSSTVRDVRVEFGGTLPEPTTPHGAADRLEGGRTVEAFMLDVPLPEYRDGPARGSILSTVRFDLRAHALDALQGPGADGQVVPMPLDALRTDEDELPAMVWIEQAFSDSVPAGPYQLSLVYRPPVERTDIPWLPALVLGLPLVAGIPASRNIHIYRVEARGPYQRTARALFFVGIVVGVVFAMLVAIALAVLGWRRLSVFPPDTATVLVYVQVAIVFLAFLLLWHLAGRSFVDAMRDDLRRRERQEEELRRSNEELERFAYVASHDLQEPLRRVAASTMMIRNRYEGQLDEGADRWIGYAVDGAHRMQDMIQSLLTYARVGQGSLRVEDVDVQALAESVVQDLGQSVRERDAEVHVENLPTLRADPDRLRQVLQNLIQNGLKYQAPGARPQVLVDAARQGAGWDIRVRDNGIGIPAGQREAVFDPFLRLHEREEVEGTGIGLAICARIVERHGGRIHVESVQGEGSTFHVWLPAEGPPEP